MDVNMNYEWLLFPPVAFLIFFILLSSVYRIIKRYSAKGMDQQEKYLPYTGGQKIDPTEIQLSYKAFFRLGLLFGIVHVAVLVLSTLPLERKSIIFGLFYLSGISISAFVLAQTNSGDDKDSSR
jgi:hypothetical protein